MAYTDGILFVCIWTIEEKWRCNMVDFVEHWRGSFDGNKTPMALASGDPAHLKT